MKTIFVYLLLTIGAVLMAQETPVVVVVAKATAFEAGEDYFGKVLVRFCEDHEITSDWGQIKSYRPLMYYADIQVCARAPSVSCSVLYAIYCDESSWIVHVRYQMIAAKYEIRQGFSFDTVAIWKERYDGKNGVSDATVFGFIRRSSFYLNEIDPVSAVQPLYICRGNGVFEESVSIDDVKKAIVRSTIDRAERDARKTKYMLIIADPPP